MLKVGLTGNIASGKSSVAAVWRELGARVVDADELARRAVEPGSPALAEIVERWGPAILTPAGTLDRDAMRASVFADAAARAELEAIIHPRVAALRDDEFSRAEQSDERVIVADIPLLFEVGLADEFDLVVLVDAPEAIRWGRIVRARGLSPADASRMIAAQMPSERKRALAHLVIDNTGSLEELHSEAARVWDEITRRADAAA